MRTQLAIMIVLAGCSTEQPGEEHTESADAAREMRRMSTAPEDAGSAASAAGPRASEPDDSAPARDGGPTDVDASAAAPSDVPDAALAAATPAADVASAPAPDGRVGSACQRDEDCADLGAGHRCLKEGDLGSPAGYCTRDCDPLLPPQCGSGAACVNYNGETSCQRVCTKAADCRLDDGYLCAPFVVFGLCLHPDTR